MKSSVLQSNLVMDGAMGTMLLQHGLSVESCLEELNLVRPSLILEIHRSYLDAGAKILVANTFGGNRPRLEVSKKGRLLERINRTGVRLARKAAGGKSRVFASIGPLGRDARKMTSSQMFRFFKEQVEALEAERPDGFLVETIPSLGEAEAATVAVRTVSDRPVAVLMTFPRGLEGAVGETLEVIAATLRAAGADRIGANCGKGPAETYTVMRALSFIDPGPFCARPAGGLPFFQVTPEEFARWGVRLRKTGCQWIGGCCGTTPAHIRSLCEAL